MYQLNGDVIFFAYLSYITMFTGHAHACVWSRDTVCVTHYICIPFVKGASMLVFWMLCILTHLSTMQCIKNTSASNY